MGVTDGERKAFAYSAVVLQVLLIILFAAATKYEGEDYTLIDSLKVGPTTEYVIEPVTGRMYGPYQDVHVMIFIGFGMLMLFAGRMMYSAIGFNMMIATFVIQWSIIVLGFFGKLHEDSSSDNGGPGFNSPIHVSVESLIAGDFTAAAVLISFGAVLGKVSPHQLLWMGFLEVVFFALNEMIGVKVLKAADIGGSMFVHTFGAYFGLAVAVVTRPPKSDQTKVHYGSGSSYHSDIFSMVGTVFLWMFWPSFNGALAGGQQQQRVVINTVLSLCACSMAAFAASCLMRPGNRFDMVDIQNATLAGGVAVGTTADFMIQPWGAATIGLVAGFLSVAGYVYIQPWLLAKFGIDDTCGVHNLHGMPGILAALGGIFACFNAVKSTYGNELTDVLGALDSADEDRSPSEQAGFQFLALFLTLVIAIIGGVVTGFLIKLPIFGPLLRQDQYDDEQFWEVAPYEAREENPYSNATQVVNVQKVAPETEITAYEAA